VLATGNENERSPDLANQEPAARHTSLSK